jgi:acyl carrier protein
MLKVWTVTAIEAEIETQVHAILSEKQRPIRKLTPADKLNDTLGLSSLDLAILVSELELSFGADPFAQLVPITDIRSIGDLVRAYSLALIPEQVTAKPDDGLSAAADRARQRVNRRKT